jgi:membrane-bound ClpP family serine protease
MSEIIEALLDAISIIADNPASILIVLGFLAILIGWAFGVTLFIVLGIFMLIIGIVVHVMWLER